MTTRASTSFASPSIWGNYNVGEEQQLGLGAQYIPDSAPMVVPEKPVVVANEAPRTSPTTWGGLMDSQRASATNSLKHKANQKLREYGANNDFFQGATPPPKSQPFYSKDNLSFDYDTNKYYVPNRLKTVWNGDSSSFTGDLDFDGNLNANYKYTL